MSTLTTTAPAVTKRIVYNRDDHDFSAFVSIDGGPEEYIGSRPSQGACDVLCDAYAYHFYADRHTPEKAAQIAVAAFDPEPAPPVDDGPEDNFGGFRNNVNWSSAPLTRQIARSQDTISAVIFELALTDAPALVEFLRGHTAVQRDVLAWRFTAWLRRHHGIVREPAHIAAGWAALIAGAGAGAGACGAPRPDVSAGRAIFRQWCQDRVWFVRTLAQLDAAKRRELAESYVAFLKSVSPTDLNPTRMLYRWQREIDRATAVERGA